MEDILISNETHNLAKEKGLVFPRKADLYIVHSTGNRLYTDGPEYKEAIPTQSLVQKYLRDKYNIFVDVHVANYAWNNKFSFFRSVRLIEGKNNDKFYSYRQQEVSTYEEALEKGLQEGLKLIPTKKK